MSNYYSLEQVLTIFGFDEKELKILLAEDEYWKKIRRHKQGSQVFFQKDDIDDLKSTIFTEPTIQLTLEEEEEEEY